MLSSLSVAGCSRQDLAAWARLGVQGGPFCYVVGVKIFRGLPQDLCMYHVCGDDTE